MMLRAGRDGVGGGGVRSAPLIVVRGGGGLGVRGARCGVAVLEGNKNNNDVRIRVRCPYLQLQLASRASYSR